MPANDIQVLLLTVNYLTPELTARFLDHVASVPEGIAVAVADNDGSWGDRKTPNERAQVYTPGENLGYFGGCAYALARWQHEHGVLPAWVAVVNTDIEFEEGFFSQLLGHDLPDEVSVIGPDIRLRDGTPQNPFIAARPSRKRIYAYTVIFRSLFLATLMDYAHLLKCQLQQRRARQDTAQTRGDITPIYAPHGAAMFFRRRFFERGGTLRYRAFLYKEEIHVAEQLRRLGMQAAYLPDLRIRHDEHTTVRRVARRRLLHYEYESARVIWEDYFAHE